MDRHSYVLLAVKAINQILVLQTYTQFIQPRHDLNSVHLEEVRQELGYLDLLVHDAAHTSLTN
jgi:hypothetical protein